MKRNHLKKLCNNSNDKRPTGHIALLLLFKFLNDYKLNRIHNTLMQTELMVGNLSVTVKMMKGASLHYSSTNERKKARSQSMKSNDKSTQLQDNPC